MTPPLRRIQLQLKDTFFFSIVVIRTQMAKYLKAIGINSRKFEYRTTALVELSEWKLKL